MRKLFILFTLLCTYGFCMEAAKETPLGKRLLEIQKNRKNPEVLQTLLPIVRNSLHSCKVEALLMTRLRNKDISKAEFRNVSEKIAALLATKVMECLATVAVEMETPVAPTTGYQLMRSVEIVTVMRSGDALLNTFIDYFTEANVSKILVQRDEETALPDFKYMKLSNSLALDRDVIILEPMIATGGSLTMVIDLLKQKGVPEGNIIIASVCAAPEGLVALCDQFPNIRVVLVALDEKLNEKKYIVPGLGDFGDRYF